MHYSYVSASHDFTHLASQGLFLYGACLDSEPLNFASKSVEFVHASLYHFSLKNKPTLHFSRYIWKSLFRDTSCCNFSPHCYFSIIVPEICKMCNLRWNSSKLCGNDQMTHCM